MAKGPSQGQFWAKCKRSPLDKHAPVICSFLEFLGIQFLWHSQLLLRYPCSWSSHIWNTIWKMFGGCTAEDVSEWQDGRMARWMATLHYSCSAKEANKLITLSAKHAMKCLKWPKISHNFRWLLCDLHLNLVLLDTFRITGCASNSLVAGNFKYAHKLHSGCVSVAPLTSSLVKCQLPATPVNCG